MLSTSYLVGTLIKNYYTLPDYKSVKRITVADTVYNFPRLILITHVSYLLFKSTRTRIRKRDPILNEDVDLIQFLQGARVRDIYRKGTT